MRVKLSAVLSEFKRNEVSGEVVSILRDDLLSSLAACWHTVRLSLPAHHLDREVETEGKTQQELWELLWRGVEPDMDGLLAALDRPPTIGLWTFQRARQLRCIYPDGSIHNWVKQFLSVAFAAAVQKSVGRTSAVQKSVGRGGSR